MPAPSAGVVFLFLATVAAGPVLTNINVKAILSSGSPGSSKFANVLDTLNHLVTELEREDSWDAHNTTRMIEILGESATEIRGFNEQVHLEINRIDTTIQFHITTEHSVGVQTQQLAGRREALETDLAENDKKVEEARVQLEGQLKVFQAVSRVLADAILQNNADASKIQPLVELIQTAGYNGMFQSTSTNSTGIDAEGLTLAQQLLDFVEKSIEDIQGKLSTLSVEGQNRRELLSDRLSRIQSEIASLIIVAHDAELTIQNLRSERDAMEFVSNTLESALDQLRHYTVIVQEAHHNRIAARSKVQRNVDRLISGTRFSSSHADFSIVSKAGCLTAEGLECSQQGYCKDGSCDCLPGFTGKFCEVSVKCGVPTNAFGSESSSNIHCNGTVAGDSCLVKCEGPNDRNVAPVPLACQTNGNWLSNVPSCESVSNAPQCNVDDLVRNAPQFSRLRCSGNRAGDFCDYSCETGKTPKDRHDFRVECSADGSWSTMPPADACANVLCNRFTDDSIPNGHVECSGFGHSDVCKFECNDGFQMIGFSVVRCLSNSTWSEPNIPSCVPSACPALSGPQYGRLECSGSGRNVGDKCHVVCDSGYYHPGDLTRMCLSSTGWSGQMIRACIPMECSGPPEASNGVKVCTKHSTESSSVSSPLAKYVPELRNHTTTVCNYECPNGREGRHSARLECVNGTFWAGDVNDCEINKCSVHPPLRHGSLSCNEECSAKPNFLLPTETREAAKCQVTCDEGFELVGTKEWSCEVSSGKWNAESYCRPKSCGPAPTVNNAFVMCTGDNPGHKCATYCNGGFHLPEDQPLGFTCRGGNWVANNTRTFDGSNEYQCLPRPCGSLPAPLYGYHNCSGTSFSDVCSVVCANGDVLMGSKDIICREDGRWEGSGVCVPDTCPSLDAPPHGFLSCSSNTFDGECSVQCVPGFQLVDGDSHRRCLPGGVWSGKSPRCVPVMCSAPTPSRAHTHTVLGDWKCTSSGKFFDNLEVSEESLPYLSHCQLDCPKGFTTEPGDWICGAGGAWIPEMNHTSHSITHEVCRPIDCGPPPFIPHARPVCGESSCRMVCQLGFELSGSKNATVTCDRNTGEWIYDKSLECSVSTCGAPPEPFSGATKQCAPPLPVSTNLPIRELQVLADSEGDNLELSTVTNASCTYLCGDDSGSIYGIVCGASGNWQAERGMSYPPCARSCGTPRKPANGSIICDDHRTECEVRCDPGFEIVGESHVNCKGFGEWSSKVGKCVPITCPNIPETIENGHQICDGRTYASRCEFYCAPGFMLSGSQYATCSSNGQWSIESSEPKCVPRTCPSDVGYQHHSHVTFSCEGFDERSICTSKCDPGYTLVEGSEIRQCNGNGVWSGPPPVCRKVHCQKLENPANGRLDCSGNAFGDKCEVICNAPHAVVGDHVRECRASGEWSGGVAPFCAI